MTNTQIKKRFRKNL